jgi:CBS domain containing-hemolysin-like protein
MIWLALCSLAQASGSMEAIVVDPWVAATPYVGAALVLLLLSGFFSGSETALFSLQPLDRKRLEEDGHEKLRSLITAPRKTLATLLIGNEFTNVTLSSVTAGLLLMLAPDSPWLNVIGLTPVIVVFGEVMPKVVALRWNRRIAPLIATPLSLFATLVAPLRWLLTQAADAALVLTGGSTAPKQAELREAQLRTLIDEGREAGNLGATEQEMLHKVFEFGDLSVHRLMTPRPDIQTVRLGTPWLDLLAQLRASQVSRIPVWQGRPDDFKGVLVVKKLLPFLLRVQNGGAPPSTSEIRSVLLPCRYVPTTKRAEDMLREFRTERFHMSIVVDEHGNIVGLVTLDDLLSELVGELLDEHDDEDPEVTAYERDIFTVRAGMDVSDFADRFGVTLPEGEYTTVGGFILAELGDLPDEGAEVVWKGLRFVVSEVTDRRVTELAVCPVDTPVDVLEQVSATK